MTQTVCLNMIVKNESRVIRRCLDSVLPLISTWCILDTGSSDGTQELIRDHLGSLPGTLHQSDWKGFGPSRSEAIQLARDQADYLLFIDADDQMVLPEGYRLPHLDLECYQIQHRMDPIAFMRRDLVATRLAWRYVGILHEYVDCDGPCRTGDLPGPFVLERREGARSQDPRKYEKDAELLEQGLLDEPHNARYRFYLAQSYRDAGRLNQALANYRLRVAMGGWEEEVFYALLQVGRLLEGLGRPAAEVIPAYLEAYQYRPRRVEPLVELARFHRLRQDWALAYLYARQAVELPLPNDILFIDGAAYDWKALDEYAIACYWTGRRQEAREACQRLLAERRFPDQERDRILKNLSFSAAS